MARKKSKAPKTYTVTLTLPGGSRKYFRGSTKKEAEKRRDDARLKVGMGVDINCDTTVSELAQIWFTTYKDENKDLHKRSKETTRNVIKRYLDPTIGNMKVADVKPIHIQQLMNSVSGYSESTQKKVLQAARAIFSVAEDNGMIQKTPISKNVKAGGAKPIEPEPLTPTQSAALLQAVKGTRAYLLVLVLLHTGMRIGEALGLRWRDFDFVAGTVSVNRSIVYPEDNRQGEVNEDLKTVNARRTIPLPWTVMAEIKNAKTASHSLWVFAMQDGSFLSYNSFRALWRIIDYRTTTKRKVNGREIVQRTLDFDVHPHLLRHTRITRWFEAGLDIKEVQYLAGHATPDITLRIYTHYQAKLRRAETAQKIRAAAV